QIAVARVNVVGADRDVPGKLLFDTDARLARVRQMPVWIVEVHGPGVLLDGARRVELVHQRAIDDRTVDEERIGRHPPGGWTRINARGRWTDRRGAGAAEERRERVRQRASRDERREVRIGGLLEVQTPAAPHDRRGG